jgi:hypothetical protein
MENVYSIYLNSLNLGGRWGGGGGWHFHASCRPEIGIERIQTWHPGIEHPPHQGMGEVLSQKILLYNWRVFHCWHCTDKFRIFFSFKIPMAEEHRLGISKEDEEWSIPEDIYQFTLLFFVPDVVYLFICPLLLYFYLSIVLYGCMFAPVHLHPTLVFKRKSITVNCPLKPNVWGSLPVQSIAL